MNDNLPAKNILIYDPFSPNGLELAIRLHTKGFNVVLFCDLQMISSDNSAYFINPNVSIVIYPNTFAAVEDYINMESSSSIEKIIILKSIIDSNLIFGSDDFEGILYKIRPIEKLYDFAKLHEITIVEIPEWHCTLEFIDHVVDKMDSIICNNEIRKITINNLELDFFISENSLYVNYLDRLLDDINVDLSLDNMNCYRLSFRSLIRMYFEELGVEIEFCGKSIHERAVIVDYLEDNLALINSPFSKIRLGNTIIKIDENNYNRFVRVFKENFTTNLSNHGKKEGFKAVKQLIKVRLYKNKK